MNTTVMKHVIGVCAVVLSTTALAFNKSMYPYDLPSGKQGAAMGCIEAKAGMKLEPGKWYTNFQVCKDYADANGIPLVAIWSNESCIHCWYTDVVFIQDEFVQWKQTHAAGQVIYCFMAGGYGGYDQSGSAAYNWMWYGGGSPKLNAYPFVVLWWKKENVNERYTGDGFCNTTTLTEASIPGRVTTVEGRLEKAFAKWSPAPTYAGGVFTDPDTEGNRLEFEGTTAKVTVNLAREETSKDVATNVTLVVQSPTGVPLASQKVVWAAGTMETSATIELSKAMKGTCTKDGQQLTLYLVDGGKNHSTNHITYVDREASSANPLWKGEKFGFGEWTCDYVEATNMVKNAKGSAYTIVGVQGSLWCPDCANTDRNFLELTDGSGANLFCAWAKSKNITLVSMDVPNYGGPNVSDRNRPTLFTKEAYATKLARNTQRENPEISGADPVLTNSIVRSGLGYLTRKGVTDEQAWDQLVMFHDLSYKYVGEGGFRRPEDLEDLGRKYDPGIPSFILLRKDGSVAARFTRFNNVSPMKADRANFDNYLKRFDEMIAIADAAPGSVDATETGNNYPGIGSVVMEANGGEAKGRVSHVDNKDVFKLKNFDGNAIERIVVTGASSLATTVQFLTLDAQGQAQVVGASATGKLSEGITLSHEFDQAGDYYVRVSASVSEADYDLCSTNSTASNFHEFTVRGSTVLVPQGDQAKAKAPVDSDKVVIRLEKGLVYCFSGVTTNDNPFLVEMGSMGVYAFLASEEEGDVEVKVATGLGGEISYQIWQPGQVAFVTSGTNVLESVNDLNHDWVEFQVARINGKSGRVKARVAVDLDKSTIESTRYELATNAPNGAVDFTWEDGETSNMTVRVRIEDDTLYDGDRALFFNLEVLASDAGDVTVAEGRGVYQMNVLEDDKSEPGRALITRTTPDYGRKGTVYVRESDGAEIWIERIEACDGLVEANLVSSLASVTYEAENPRDIGTNAQGPCVYWSSRESQEKYVRVKGIPAGKSARIQLKSCGNFETVSGSNTVTVVAVADDAPAFATESSTFDLYRYVLSRGVSVKLDGATIQGGKVAFSKLSGTLPAGLSASYDAEAKALVFAGTVTAKPGTYETTYQVVETRSGKRVAGLTTAVKFVVIDPTDIKTNPQGANPAVGTVRTFKDVPVVNPIYKRMAGVLQLTIPTRGNVSGKYFCESGVFSLAGTGWGDFNPVTKGLSAKLVNTRAGVTAGITANADGSVDVVVSDPSYPSTQLDATIPGVQWSQKNTAEKWQGYYTVVLPVEQILTNTTECVAPTGAAFLTLDFTSKSAWKTGTVKWAGMLPNGTAVSGSSVLGAPYDGKSADGETKSVWAKLPVFRRSSTDVLSVCARIQRDAKSIVESDRRAVLSAENVIAAWSHGERQTTAGDYLVNLGVYGAIYDKMEDLGGCCQEYYQTNEMLLGFDLSQLGTTYYGVPEAIDPLSVTVTEDTMTINQDQPNPANVKLSLNRSTGVVSGSLVLACPDKDLSATYRGVVLTGWGEGCGCGPTAGLKVMPFVNGSYFFSDKIDCSDERTISVKRGGMVLVDAAVE